jgi:hypothetical protein
MGVAGGVLGNRAQPEPLGRVEAHALDAAVVERQALGLAVFEVELAVIHSGERAANQRLDPRRVHAGAFEEQMVGHGEVGHSRLHELSAPIWSRRSGGERREMPGAVIAAGKLRRLAAIG